MKEWTMYEDGATIGTSGSEDGRIIADEEFDETCHITLEECPMYHAITCGIYGAMVHTCFCAPEKSMAVYEAMKAELARFVCTEYSEEERYDFYEYFCGKYCCC